MDDNPVKLLARTSRLAGALAERNRIMEILVKFKRAGWLDDSTCTLLADDICVDIIAEGENK